MGVEYRKDRDRWGYRLNFRNGKRLKVYKWFTKEEAEAAYREAAKVMKLPPTALSIAAEDYAADSIQKRSYYRYEGIRINLEKWIVPFFGEDTPITAITPERVEEFISFHKKRQVKNITIWHYVKDLRAMLNWCIKKGRLNENPVVRADLSVIKNRKSIKLPLNIEAIDRGLRVLRGREKLYADTLRYMGLRKDEGNRIQAKDILDYGEQMWLVVQGTKTDDSRRVLPIPPVLQASYRHYLSEAQPGDYILSPDGKDKIYSRRRMFERVSEEAGIRVKAKDLRDYFASIIDDPVTASQMLGHTNLRTTAIYVRQVQSRMIEAVELLGARGTGASIGGQNATNQDEKQPIGSETEAEYPPKYLN